MIVFQNKLRNRQASLKTAEDGRHPFLAPSRRRRNAHAEELRRCV